MFEKHGPSRSIRKYVDLPDDLPYGGEHWHGDQEDFMGESLAAKYSYGIGDGAEFPCIGMGTKHIGLELGVSARFPEPDAYKIGLKLAVVGQLPPPPKYKIGLKLAVNYHSDYDAYKIGLHLATKGQLWEPTPETGKVGLHLAVTGDLAPPPPETKDVGLHLAVTGQLWEPIPETGKVGLHLAVNTSPVEEITPIALHLAVNGRLWEPTPEVGNVALHVAVTGIAVGGGVGDPGTDCESALLVELGTWGPYTITTGDDEQWFKWIIYLIPLWHITVTVTDGEGATFKVWYGIDCFHLFLLHEGTNTFCVTPGFTDTGTNWLEVIPPEGGGSVTYTFELAPGLCP